MTWATTAGRSAAVLTPSGGSGFGVPRSAGTYNWLTVLDESHHFVFLIEDVPVRFYRSSADEPTSHTLRRQAVEAQQLALAFGEERAEALVFRLALEASAATGVERVVFLALRGDEGQVECFWPVPLVIPPAGQVGPEPIQLRPAW